MLRLCERLRSNWQGAAFAFPLRRPFAVSSKRSLTGRRRSTRSVRRWIILSAIRPEVGPSWT